MDDWDESPAVISDPGWSVSSNMIQTQEYSNSRYGGGGGGGGGGGFGQSRGRSQRNGSDYNNRRSDNQYSDNSNTWRSNSKQSFGEDVMFEVPSRFVGRIIGKGGSKINSLQSESGARINVLKEYNGDNTIVKLNGTTEQIEKAKELISELTVDRPQYTIPAASDSQYQESQNTGESHDIDWGKMAEECDRVTKERWAKMPEIVKNFYQEKAEIAMMPPDQVAAFRESQNNVVVSRVFNKEGNKSKRIPNPVQTFEQAFHNYPEILQEIRNAGFTTPSPIQCQAWPILLSGEDMIGIAQTGTGKTLAFLLPALIHIDGQTMPREQRDGPTVLVLAPTRELAQQIEREVAKYQYRGINAVCVYGGKGRKEQIQTIAKGINIVIATPGRLYDLMSNGHLIIEHVTYVVLDEADRMLDMGFEPQIRKILYKVRPDRQTVMTSATWPLGVRRLADSYMEDPVQVYVGSLDLAAVHSVTQTIVMMGDSEEEKFNTVLQFADNLKEDEKVIIFCGKKARADHLSSEFTMYNIPCQCIHGDREQDDREQAVADITDGTVQILIATDVASRGLDILDITHVVNYDFPRNIEEYVHRVGRTGRAGRTGQSISYFTRGDWGQAKELITILEEACQYVPEELFQMATRYESWKERKDADKSRFGGRRGGGGGGGGGGRYGNAW